MTTDIVYQYSKEGLLEALEARRSWAVQHDKREAAKHKADEAAHLAQFRRDLREALKWDYETANAKGWEPRGQDIRWRRPRCPVSAVQSLDATIEAVKRDGRKRYRISHKNWNTAHWLLSHDDEQKRDLCA